jgi:transposase
MDRAALDSLDREGLIGIILMQFEAIERLTAEIAALRAENVELRAQNAELRAQNAQLRAKLDQPPKTPDNSSLPPSRGQKASSPAKDKAKRKAHAGAHRPLHPNPTHRRDVFACACQHCGADVSQSPQLACEAYDRIEIPDIKPDVTRVTLHGGVCPCCAGRFKAEPPEGLEPGSPFGPNLRAFIVYLRFTQGVGFERLARLLFDLMGLEISEGALINILKAARGPFAAASAAIRARLLAGTAICSDETGLRVGKRSWWLWVFHHDDSAFFMAHPRRGKMAVEQFLGPVRPDFWVSDRYGSQMGWAQKDHQICLAHLIRDIQYVIDEGDDVFAPGLRHLIGRACRIGRRRYKLADASLKIYAARLEADLDELLALTPTNAAGVKLQGVIEKFRRHLFVFMTNRAIPPTNNGSERSLRPCVTFRKITNGFRSQWGAHLYANIRSVIETARRRSIGPLQAIRFALEGKSLPIAP